MKKDELVVTSLASEILDNVFMSYKKISLIYLRKMIMVTPTQKCEIL